MQLAGAVQYLQLANARLSRQLLDRLQVTSLMLKLWKEQV